MIFSVNMTIKIGRSPLTKLQIEKAAVVENVKESDASVDMTTVSFIDILLNGLQKASTFFKMTDLLLQRNDWRVILT